MSQQYHSIQRAWSFAISILVLMLVAACGTTSPASNPGVDLGSGTLLAFIGNDGNLWLAQGNGDNSHAVTTAQCQPTATCFGPPVWSPNGQTIAAFGPNPTGTGNSIDLFNRQGLLIRSLIPPDTQSFGSLLWLHDNTTIAFQGRTKQTSANQPSPVAIILMNATTGQVNGTIPLPAPQNNDLVCSDSSQGSPISSLVDRAINGVHGLRYSFDVTANDQAFMVSSGYCLSQVTLIQRGNGQAQTLQGVEANTAVLQAAFSPDGQHIVAVQNTDSTDTLVEYAADGTQGKNIYAVSGQIMPFVARISSPTWSANGNLIYFMVNADLWTINADGSNPHMLIKGSTDTNNVKVESMPLPAPNLQSLAWLELSFAQGDTYPRSALMVGNADAGNPHLVALGAIWPAWS